MTCPRCREAVNEASRKCAFPDGNSFMADNWNCATMSELRSLATSNAGTTYNIRWDDESWAVINVIGVDFERDDFSTFWLSWYKNQGRTDGALLVNVFGSEVPSYPC